MTERDPLEVYNNHLVPTVMRIDKPRGAGV